MRDQFSAMVRQQKGGLYAFSAFFLWGILPFYFKTLQSVAPEEILLHRMLWSAVFCVILLMMAKKLKSVFELTWRDFFALLLTSVLLVINWFFYVLAVNTDQIVEASMGYFISPLIGIFLGIIFLKEKPTLFRIMAIFCAISGVGYLIWQFSAIPFFALVLSCSFGLYGFFKKVLKMDALKSFALETIILFPAALLYFLYYENTHQSHFATTLEITIKMIGLGVITSVPLILFAAAARNLKQLTSLSFFQYITPSCQLIIGIIFYNESFTTTHFISFGLIWSGLILMVSDSMYKRKS